MSSAIPSSTIIGMPLVAAVAAKNKPFSIDRKPMTCGTALDRVIIIMNDSRMQASAMPSVPRAIDRLHARRAVDVHGRRDAVDQ